MRMGGSGILNMQLEGRGRMSGWCPAAVYLSGQTSDWMEVSMYDIDDLMALEVYPSETGAPRPSVMPDATEQCGVVLAWTKWEMARRQAVHRGDRCRPYRWRLANIWRA